MSACVLLGVAGRRFFSERTGLIAAGMLAVYPWAIFSDGLIQKSSVDAFLIAAVLASLALFLFRPHWKWAMAAGLALGAFSLNRETGRLLYPVVVFWLLYYFRATQLLRERITWVPLAVFGIWHSCAHWKRLALLYAVLLLLLLSVAAFFVLARYRYPAVPVAMLFAACGLSALAEFRRPATPKSAFWSKAAPGVVLAVVAVFVTPLSLPAIYRDTTLFNVGLGYLKSDRPSDAIPWLQQAVQRAPDDAAAYFALGVTDHRTGQFVEAVDALRSAVRLNPNDPEAREALAGSLTNFGMSRSAAGDTERALSAFLESLSLRPNDATTHNNLGLALHGVGRVDRAVQEIREAV